MKLAKAIEIVAVLENEPSVPRGSDRWDAVRLLIEAGKRLQVFREYDAFGHRVLLPGETED